MDYLVTGGAGFIGSNLVEAIVERGHSVRVFDNGATGKLENLAAVRDRIEFVEGDLSDPKALARACVGVERVLHQAALASVPGSIEDPMTYHEKNETGTLNLLVAARDAGVKRVVIASSASIYGDSPESPKVESMIPQPKSPYAVNKLTCEHYAKVFWEIYQLETVCLRYFNVYGPRQDPASQYSSVIPKFVTMMLAGETPTIFGDGEQSRDFVYIKDVIQANLKAANVPGAAGSVVNVASSKRYTLNDLVRIINEILGTKIEPVYAEERAGDVKHSHADISRARQVLGFEPEWSFEEGLRETVEWYRNVGNAKHNAPLAR